MDNLPLVTIGIPTFNRLELLKNSLKSAIFQTYSNLEIIVSNNASTDGTKEWLESFCDPRIKVFHQDKNLRMVSNWNVCVKAATGKYFMLLSDDDFLDINFITEVIKTINSVKDEPVLCFSNLCIVNSEELPDKVKGKSLALRKEYFTEITSTKFICNFLIGKPLVFPCGILFKTKELIAIDNFPEFYTLAADAAAWIRILMQSRESSFIFSENAVAFYRRHDASATAENKKILWAQEILDLILEFQGLALKNKRTLPNEFNAVLYRAMARNLFFNSKSKMIFFKDLFLLSKKFKPTFKEFLFSAVRWNISDQNWNKIKRFLN